MKSNIEILNKLVSGDSDWNEQAQTRQNNAYWLKHSQQIAIKILKTLRERNMKQTEFAALLNVSPQQVNKIVKGKENLTLETISRIEEVLKISIILVMDAPQPMQPQYVIQNES